MKYPKFFDEIETIKLKDDLSAVLGSLEDGVVEFSYLDIVKSAGHSCPTVAGAFLMTQIALKNLYKNETPKRGEIFVSFKEDSLEGTAGVIANVVSQITGATEFLGFKGLNGKFARHDLMFFKKSIPSNARFTRLDTGQAVDVFYDPSIVKGSPEMNPLMQKIMAGVADSEEKKLFGALWQKRVKEILVDHVDDPNVIWTRKV